MVPVGLSLCWENPPLVPILSQMHLFHIVTTQCSTIHLNIILPSMP